MLGLRVAVVACADFDAVAVDAFCGFKFRSSTVQGEPMEDYFPASYKRSLAHTVI